MPSSVDLVSGIWDDPTLTLTEDQGSALFASIARSGVTGSPSSTDLQPFGDSSGMVAKVRPSLTGAWVNGTWGFLAATASIDIPSNSDATNARIDRIVLRRVPATNKLSLVRIPGTAASTPTVPPLVDANDLPIAQVRVEATAGTVGSAIQSIASSKVVNDRRHTGIATVPCTAATRPTQAWPGQQIWVDDLSRLEVWTGAAWLPLPGFDDTGWGTIASASYGSGWGEYAGGGNYPPHTQVRRINSRVWLRGQIVRLTTGTGGSNALITLPSGYAPPYTHRWDTIVDNAGPLVGVSIVLNTLGQLNILTPTTIAANAVIPVYFHWLND